MNTLKIHFLGASGTVTGSKFLLETPERNILIDCGMFQGLKELREQNWKELPFDVSRIDTVLLTHGHLDHTGYLPRLVKQGFTGKIFGTAPTLEITKIILLDSAKINEEDAERANEESYSKHQPALPFYTVEDAERTIKMFVPPEKPQWADYLFLESTYGGKLHPAEGVSDKLIALINKTVHNRGTLIIPSFAVERLQTLMFLLWELYNERRIPNIPIFIDSPMGNNVLGVFERFASWHKIPQAEFSAMKHRMNSIKSYKETWETIDDPRPKIVIAGSGMVTGGRVLTYMKQLIDEPTTTILMVGYQAEGTRGRQLLEGAHELRFFGKYYPVKATVEHIESLSAHADQNGILDWLSEIKNVPENTFLIHGELTALDALRVKIQDVYGWRVTLPKLYSTVEVSI